MEIKKPKKSQGVPKQNRSGTLLQEINDTFIEPYGSKYLKNLYNSIEDSGFWDASLSEQMVILSKLFYDSVSDQKKLIELLKNSHAFNSSRKGKQTENKKFILATLTLKEKESKSISKNFHFVDYNSTPRLPGKYTMILFCDGNEIMKKSFIYSG